MARRISSRTVMNRKALDAISEGMAAAMERVGQDFVETVDPPDATPFGEGLVTSPDWGVWAYGKKVAGTAKKPRKAKARKDGILLVAGEGFPGRFQELGTIHHGAQPHVTPAMVAVLNGLPDRLREEVDPRLKRVR